MTPAIKENRRKTITSGTVDHVVKSSNVRFEEVCMLASNYVSMLSPSDSFRQVALQFIDSDSMQNDGNNVSIVASPRSMIDGGGVLNYPNKH